MRKLVASALVTLDGVSEDPVGFEGTANGGWSLPFFDEQAVESAQALLDNTEVFLCGRPTYEGFAKFGPAIPGKYSQTLNAMPKLVASTTLNAPLTWNATLLGGDVVENIKQLKVQPGGNILTYGGGKLLATLMAAELVDEYKVAVHPLILGSGRRLFRDGLGKTPLRLVDGAPYASGVTVLTYVVA